MKPAPFRYYAPSNLDEALALLTEHGYDAKLLAGGQSLVPTMNFRLAQPTILIDLNNISELDHITLTDTQSVCTGAMTRQRTVEQSALIQQHAPLLHATMPLIAHTQIRNRGTIGGSLAHADPAAELPAVAVVSDAQFKIQSQAGTRWIAARDFYVTLFTTDLAPDEILTEIHWPLLSPRTGWAIQEVARRHGDYALVGVTALVTLDDQGHCAAADIALISVGEGPVMAPNGAALLHGEKPTEALIATVAETVAQVDIDPTPDIHASAAYRRHLAKVLTQRVLTQAFMLGTF